MTNNKPQTLSRFNNGLEALKVDISTFTTLWTLYQDSKFSTFYDAIRKFIPKEKNKLLSKIFISRKENLLVIYATYLWMLRDLS